MGLTFGAVFAAEIGEPRGRREFNILGDPVNTAARLMAQASQNQILLTEEVYERIGDRYKCQSVGEITLKGKSHPLPCYTLLDRKKD
jgi:class 3 adenylate cyclase